MKVKGLPLVYTAMSKKLFYFREHISKFVLEQGCVPLNPFMSFHYFLLDTVERNIVRNANNNYVIRGDKTWVFGPIADGVLEEIRLASMEGKPIKYFKVVNSKDIVEISKEEVEFEEGLEKYASEL